MRRAGGGSRAAGSHRPPALSLQGCTGAPDTPGLVDTWRPLRAHAFGAALGGIFGAFLASLLNTVNADQFLYSFSILVLAMVILGGVGSTWGVVLGAIVLSTINNWLTPDVINQVAVRLGLAYDPAAISYGVDGFLLVVMMILRPRGLLPEKRQAAAEFGRCRSRADEPGTRFHQRSRVECHERDPYSVRGDAGTGPRLSGALT